MRTLSIDIETYSGADIAKTGAYRYAADEDFDLLLFAYSIDDQPVQVVSVATGETVPDDVVAALTDPTVIKYAFNAQFERACLSRWLQQTGRLDAGVFIDPAGWRCTMVWCSAIGLPMSLDNAAKVLKLDAQKNTVGKELIKLFCTPHTVKQVAGDALFSAEGLYHRTRPKDAPEKWLDFIEYNRQDVVVELAIRERIERFPLPDWLWDQYATDQRINDTGIQVDTGFAKQAIAADRQYAAHCLDEAREITGLDNPGSYQQLQQWLGEQGVHMEAMGKDYVSDALKTATGAPRRVLELRQDLSRSSVKKYQAMLNCVIPGDDRAHGLIQFCGAGRTGRWAGRLIQVQNLPRNYLVDLDAARGLVAGGQHDLVEALYASLPDTLSQLIRTAFVPKDGTRFIVADYSAIEARVLAWLAGEEATLQAFRDGKDLYCATASAMFKKPVEKHGVNGELRQLGKIATLACGYQGGVGAFKAMGGERMGMTEQEMQRMVRMWRDANPNVVDFWWGIDDAVKHTITTGEQTTLRGLTITIDARMLHIWLPSGRALIYPQAGIGVNRFGNESIEFYGMNDRRQFGRIETYGGKLTENVVQAISRDLLAHALTVLEEHGHTVVMHIHDEAVVEAPPETSVGEVCALMSQAPTWAAGLPLTADGYECNYYQKD